MQDFLSIMLGDDENWHMFILSSDIPGPGAPEYNLCLGHGSFHIGLLYTHDYHSSLRVQTNKRSVP